MGVVVEVEVQEQAREMGLEMEAEMGLKIVMEVGLGTETGL